MKIRADEALSPPSGASYSERHAEPSSQRPSETTPTAGVSNRLVLLYALVTLVFLAPGLYLKWGRDIEALAALRDPLTPLQQALSDIKFGIGPRFWLGVAGATMMGLLLLYPVRKAMAARRGLGAIGGWFHLHIVLGLAGPALILYHCDFGLGGSNANVALWSMLAIAASGLVGQFVYRRVSADFYSGKAHAEQHLDAIRRVLREVDGLIPNKNRLTDELDAFHACLLAPRQGLVQSLRNRLAVRDSQRNFAAELQWIIHEGARTSNWSAERHRQVSRAAEAHLADYMRKARAGAGRALREQVWGAWRLCHLPLFLVMTAATVLHVVAVWDMDPSDAMPPAVHEAKAGAPKASESTPRVAVQQMTVRTTRVEVQSARTASPDTPVAATSPPIAPAPQATLASPPRDISDLLSESAASPAAPAPRQTATPEPPAAKPTLAVKRPPPPPAVVAEAKPVPPAPVAAPPVAIAEPVKRDPPAPAIAKDDPRPLYAELERRTETEGGLMSLGLKGRGLAEQIRLLKAQKEAGKFSHAETETGFALTGKHVRVECADCHQKPLRETRQATQRQCIDCHKQDDVHKGRRPDCAQCHVPTRWSEVRRKAKR